MPNVPPLPIELNHDLAVLAVHGVPVAKGSGIPTANALAFVKRITLAPDGCWYWLSDGPRRSYGGAGLYGGSIQAHRLSYLLFNGSLPADKEVHHKCDHKNCVNPAHLEALTPIEHFWATPQSPAHQRKIATHCVNGHPYSETATVDCRGARRCQICWRESRRRSYVKSRKGKLLRRDRTHCERGHEWKPENWRMVRDHRQCRLCYDITQAAARARRKAHKKQVAHRKTHCAHGHELTEENVKVRTDGYRECRTCMREYFKARNAAETAARAGIPRKPRTPTPRNRKTHCINGHPLTEENRYYKPDGLSQCLICRNLRNKNYKRKPRQ